MAKVISVARQFMQGHPRAGEPTYFVEKILNSLGIKFWHDKYFDLLNELNPGKEKLVMQFYYSLDAIKVEKKPHTIRNGHRWKAGDMASVRVWSNKPYNSPQIIISPDIEIKRVFDFEVCEDYYFYVNGLPFSLPPSTVREIAENDGLSEQDFLDWFQKYPLLDGQIITWDEKIEY